MIEQSVLLRKQAVALLQKATRLVFGMEFWLLYSLVIAFSVLQNGLWYSPLAQRFWLMSQDIFKNPFLDTPDSQWLLASLLGPAFGYVTHMNQSTLAYSFMHFALFLVFFTILIAVIKKKNGDFVARSVLMIFFLSPIAQVLFTWLGSPDILTTLLSTTIVVFWGNFMVLAACAFLLGTNHPEQGFVIMLLLTIFSSFTRSRKETMIFALIGCGALVVGKLFVGWYSNVYNISAEFTRWDYISKVGVVGYVKATFSNFFALMFSLYHVLILFISAYLFYFWNLKTIPRAFVLCSMVAFATILITLDQTRVFAVLTFPVLLLLVLSPNFRTLEPSEREFFETVFTLSLFVGIVIPRFVIWEGAAHFSSYLNIIRALH